MAQTSELSELVETALQNPSPVSVSAVVAAGDSAVAELEARFSSASADERANIIGIWRAICTHKAALALAPLMSSDDYDTRVRASAAAYECVRKNGLPDNPAFKEDVLAALNGEAEAGGLLLASYFPESQAGLSKHQTSTRLVKLDASDPAVPVDLVTAVALSRLGDQDARGRLETKIQEGDPANLVFLIKAMAVIDAPEILHSLASATLSNETPVGDGLPSGVTPQRRVADIATEYFVHRLKFDPGFELDPTRLYSQDERGLVARKIAEKLPN
ncbi:hypothetical protein [Labrenzia sp. PHM005]|uniref:hypothetical protein n=1 Tax=Labrenzia sp. PHM005 TaxID=2590016 RepID=UPI00114081DE|nr:hypothetical protein [Labrenzia sp. PHM005]QDG76884.1 hypothetical protein FJ695_13925 [Labrenzia sp. PHM005]